MGVVINHLIAEGVARHLTVRKECRRFLQGGGHPRGVGRVGVAPKAGASGSDSSTPRRPAATRAASARYGLTSPPGTRHSTRSEGPCPTTRKAQVRLSSPQSKRRGRERAFHEALVTVDVGSEKEGELFGVGDLSREEVLEDLREAVIAFAGEDRRAVGVAQREVYVAGVTFSLVVLGHEGDAAALLRGDLLGAEFEETVLITLVDQFGVLKGDLVLTEVALAFERLDVMPASRMARRTRPSSGSMREVPRSE